MSLTTRPTALWAMEKPVIPMTPMTRPTITPTMSRTDDDGDIGESVPGFGIGGTLTGIGGAVYLLKRRPTDNRIESTGDTEAQNRLRPGADCKFSILQAITARISHISTCTGMSPPYRAQVSQQTLTVQPAFPTTGTFATAGPANSRPGRSPHLLGQLLPFLPESSAGRRVPSRRSREAGDRRDTVLEQDARGFGVGNCGLHRRRGRDYRSLPVRRLMSAPSAW